MENYDGQKQVWKNDKGMRYQDLPFLEKLTQTETLWCLMTKEQMNASFRHINSIKSNIALCLKLKSAAPLV